MERLLTFAIGDVHGCFEKLLAVLEHCAKFAIHQQIRIVLVGDVIDRGPHSRECVEHLIGLREQMGSRLCWLRGDHEQMLLDAIPERGKASTLWQVNGGAATCASYGVEHADQIAERYPHHIEVLQHLATWAEDDVRYYVHAGVHPDRTLGQQRDRDRLNIREPFLSSEKHWRKLIVHGHTPIKNHMPDLRTNRLNLDTGACFGGPLTCAAFEADFARPVAFIDEKGLRAVSG